MMIMEYNEELGAFIKLWFVAILCICYCFLIPIRIKNGMSRLLSLLPVITIFFILPLSISTVHLSFPVFFYLTWLANFKLLLLAFNSGPLAPTPPLPFFIFVSVALLPINRKNSPDKKISDPASASASSTPAHRPLILAFKAIILAITVDLYKYKHNFHPNVILVLFICHMYLTMELGLAITAFSRMIFLGFDLEIEPQFNEPLLATSLEDFWGRRWNLVASRILRAVVYNPTRKILIPIFGKFKSQLLAICVTFLVSGIMHELMFLYTTRVRPTWEVTWYCVLQGVCMAGERAVKKMVSGRFQLHRAVSGLLTLSFVLVTTAWLFLPQLLRNGVDDKVINEYSVMVNFVMSKCMGMNV